MLLVRWRNESKRQRRALKATKLAEYSRPVFESDASPASACDAVLFVIRMATNLKVSSV